MPIQARTRQIAMRSEPPSVANRRSAAICKPRQNILWSEDRPTPWVDKPSPGGFFVTDVANCESRPRSRPRAMNVNVAHNNALRQLDGTARNRRAGRQARGITAYDRETRESRGKCGKSPGPAGAMRACRRQPRQRLHAERSIAGHGQRPRLGSELNLFDGPFRRADEVARPRPRFASREYHEMAVRPIFAMRPLAAAPLLGAVLARIRRTPTARLATVYHLIGGPRRATPVKTLLARENPFIVPPAALLRADVARRPILRPDLRDLGEAIYVYSLVTGGIIGTPLQIGPLDPIPPGMPACGNCAPRIDLIA